MADNPEGIPDYMEQEVQARIGARGNESTFVVDELEKEIIVTYTGFTDALREQYADACEERGENQIKVYHLTKEGWAIQLVRYDTANGMNGEVVWRKSIS